MEWKDVDSANGYYIEYEATAPSGRTYRICWNEDGTLPWRVEGRTFRTQPEAKAYCEALEKAAAKDDSRVQWHEVLRAITDDYKHNYEVDSGFAFERVCNLLKKKGVMA